MALWAPAGGRAQWLAQWPTPTDQRGRRHGADIQSEFDLELQTGSVLLCGRVGIHAARPLPHAISVAAPTALTQHNAGALSPAPPDFRLQKKDRMLRREEQRRNGGKDKTDYAKSGDEVYNDLLKRHLWSVPWRGRGGCMGVV